VNPSNIKKIILLSTNTSDGNSLLHRVTQHDHYTLIRKLVDMGADLQATNANGRTPVALAARNGRLKCMMLLTDEIKTRGWDVFTDGGQAIILAAYNGHNECVQELHRLGADVNVQDNDGYTGVIRAAKVGKVESIRQLRLLGAT
jgi:ankyrin repeat protein